ncbi:basic-leucine zipper transcription factor A isoform X2 [Drosophila virilis]
MARSFPSQTGPQIQACLQELRLSFEREYAIIENARRRYGEILTPSIKYYNEFLFLVPFININFNDTDEALPSEQPIDPDGQTAGCGPSKIRTSSSKAWNPMGLSCIRNKYIVNASSASGMQFFKTKTKNREQSDSMSSNPMIFKPSRKGEQPVQEQSGPEAQQQPMMLEQQGTQQPPEQAWQQRSPQRMSQEQPPGLQQPPQRLSQDQQPEQQRSPRRMSQEQQPGQQRSPQRLSQEQQAWEQRSPQRLSQDQQPEQQRSPQRMSQEQPPGQQRSPQRLSQDQQQSPKRLSQDQQPGQQRAPQRLSQEQQPGQQQSPQRLLQEQQQQRPSDARPVDAEQQKRALTTESQRQSIQQEENNKRASQAGLEESCECPAYEQLASSGSYECKAVCVQNPRYKCIAVIKAPEQADNSEDAPMSCVEHKHDTRNAGSSNGHSRVSRASHESRKSQDPRGSTPETPRDQQVDMLLDLIRAELEFAPDFIFFDAKWRIIEILREVNKRQMIHKRGDPSQCTCGPNECDPPPDPKKPGPSRLAHLKSQGCPYCANPRRR